MRLRIGLLLAGLALVLSVNPAAAVPGSERAATSAPAQQAAARAASTAALAESRRQLKAARERYRRSADPTAPSGSAPAPGSTTGPAAPGAPVPHGDDPDPPPPPLPSPGTGARNLQVRAGEFWLSLSKPSVPAGTVRVEFNNTQAEDPHDLHLAREDGSGSAHSFGVLGSGEVQSKSFVLSAGAWSLFCALPEHAERGMTARLTVSGDQTPRSR